MDQLNDPSRQQIPPQETPQVGVGSASSSRAKTPWKAIGGLLTLLILLGGVVAGLFLTQTGQDLRQRAMGPTVRYTDGVERPEHVGTTSGCAGTNVCFGRPGEGVLHENIGHGIWANNCDGRNLRCDVHKPQGVAWRYVCDGKRQVCLSNEDKIMVDRVSHYRMHVLKTDPGCGKTIQVDVWDHGMRNNTCTHGECAAHAWIVYYTGDCPAPDPTPPPTQCLAVRIMQFTDGQWVERTPQEIAEHASPGEQIRFMVAGREFSLARIRVQIDGQAVGDWQDATKDTESGQFYIDFTIPATGGSIGVEAQVI